MGNFNINKKEGGLGRKAIGQDMISAIMFGGVAATGLALNTTSPILNSIADLEDLGIDAAYDVANVVLVHHHATEFFRMNPNGQLYVRLVAQDTTMADMFSVATNMKAFLSDMNGDCRQAAVVMNPTSGYTSTLSGGLDAGVFTAIPLAQTLAEEELSLKRPIQFLIEGREFNGTVNAATDLRTLDSENVSVTILQDATIAAENALYAEYAAVGVTLGAISLAAVNENISWTSKFDITDRDNGLYINPSLSNGALANTQESNYEVLTQKGYIFARNYPGQAGTFFDDAPTCTLATSDYSFIENQRTIQKAIRLVYTALFPRLGSPILIDPDTGKMKPEVAKAYEIDAEAALVGMATSNEVSGRQAYVDENQNVSSTSRVDVEIEIVPVGVARTITANIGLVQKLS